MELHELDIHVTNRCNLRCKVCCFASNEINLDEFSAAKAIEIVREAHCLGAEHLHITGGEPLLRPDIEKMVVAACDLGMEVRLQTNGFSLTERRAQALAEAGLTAIMISIDSPVKDLNDDIRGKGAFKAGLNAVNIALANEWDVRVNAVLHQDTIKTFPDLIDMVGDMGVKRVSGFYFSPIGRGARFSRHWLGPEAYMEARQSLLKEVEVRRKRPHIRDMDIIIEPGYLSFEESLGIDSSGFTGCGAGCNHVVANRNYLLVRCDGYVFPCIFGMEAMMSVGNVNELTLEEIWSENQGWLQFDRRHLTDSGCRGCATWDLCGGGCAVYSQMILGDHAVQDPRCSPKHIVPLCPIMKYNVCGDRFGGASDDVQS